MILTVIVFLTVLFALNLHRAVRARSKVFAESSAESYNASKNRIYGLEKQLAEIQKTSAQHVRDSASLKKELETERDRANQGVRDLAILRSKLNDERKKTEAMSAALKSLCSTSWTSTANGPDTESILNKVLLRLNDGDAR